MLPYYMLVTIPIAFAFIAVDHTSVSRKSIYLGSGRLERIQKYNLALPIFFLLLFVMISCRSKDIGTDTLQYNHLFNVYGVQNFSFADIWRLESLYRFLSWTVAQITDNFQVLLLITAIITLLPVAILYCEDRRRSFMKIVLFVGMSTFVVLFSGIRQMIAVAFGVLAYMCVRKKKLILFLLVSFVALGFHHSAFMILPMYPLYHIRLKKKHLLFIVPVVLAVFFLNNQIFGALNSLLEQYEESYTAVQAGSTGAYMSLILFAAFAVFSYIVPDEFKMNEELYGLRNFLLLTVVLQCFAPVHSLAMRMNYYYIIFIPVTVAKFVDIPQVRMKQIARVASVVITLFFLWEYISTIYTSYVTGVSALDTVPYIPFWAD